MSCPSFIRTSMPRWTARVLGVVPRLCFRILLLQLQSAQVQMSAVSPSLISLRQTCRWCLTILYHFLFQWRTKMYITFPAYYTHSSFRISLFVFGPWHSGAQATSCRLGRGALLVALEGLNGSNSFWTSNVHHAPPLHPFTLCTVSGDP